MVLRALKSFMSSCFDHLKFPDLKSTSLDILAREKSLDFILNDSTFESIQIKLSTKLWLFNYTRKSKRQKFW